MQHTSKMVMVPHDVYSGLMSKQEQTYTPLVGQLSSLDQELQAILSNPNLSTDAKHQMYLQTFGRYQHLKQRQFPSTPSAITVHQQTEAVDPLPVSESQLIDSLPKPARRRGRILLNHLKANSSIRWQSNGELKDTDNTTIPGSNITDLVHYVTRNRPNAKPPPGTDEFMAMLDETNAPRETISSLEDRFHTVENVGTSFSPIDTSTPKEIQTEMRRSNQKRRQEKHATPKKRKRAKPDRYGHWVEQ